MMVNDKKMHSLLEMIDCQAYCNDVYFNWFNKNCKVCEYFDEVIECNEKCPFFNVENMMKWVKEGE